MSELAPCPFCGSKPVLKRWEVWCLCGVNFVPWDEKLNKPIPKSELIEAWNKRLGAKPVMTEPVKDYPV